MAPLAALMSCRHFGAVTLFGEGSRQRFYLTLDTLCSKHQLFFVLDGMAHVCYTIPRMVSISYSLKSGPYPENL